MATTFYPTWAQYLVFQTEACGPKQCVRGDPTDTVPVPFHGLFESTSHAVLQVQKPVLPTPKSFSVNVFNGSNGTKIPVEVRSTDTVEKMLEKLKPVLGSTLNLSYNGKPVLLQQTLCELHVKPGATFITYQKCRGG